MDTEFFITGTNSEPAMSKLGLFEESYFDSCGKAYFEKITWTEEDDNMEDKIEDNDFDGEDVNTDYEKHAKKMSLADMKKDDYYKVLGLDDLKWRATDEQIKSAYRKSVLKYHPDKLASPTPEDKQIFLRIQDAYDNLGTVEKRRAYDSTDVDLTIPTMEGDDDFFDCFSDAFLQYSRFSAIQPTPLLGNLKSSWEEVESFYKFWRDFKSWRVYNSYDEYNVEEAASRGEKRWMNQMNDAHRKKLRNTDNKKLQTLVDRAYRCDPRVMAYKHEQERIAEEKEKQLEESRRAECARLEKERLEKERLEKEAHDEEERVKKAIADEKQKVKREKKRIVKQFIDVIGSRFDMELYRLFCDQQELSFLQQLSARVSVEGINIVIDVLDTLKNSISMKADEINRIRREQDEKKKNEDAAVLEKSMESKTGVEWQLEEDHCLSQAIKKYPAGYRNRWGKIAEYVSEYSHCNRERSDAQCRARIEEIMKKNMGQDTKVDGSEAFARFQRNQGTFKEKSKVEITLDNRYDDLTAENPAPKKEEKVEKADENGWTQTQQKALEAAMQKFPASMDKTERWKAIAEAVPGKSKTDCIKRVKWIHEQVTAKK